MPKITRISSGGPYEEEIGYCRAVVANGLVHVSGTTGVGDDPQSQCRSALQTIEGALEKAGCDFSDVLRVTYYLPDRNDFPALWPILRETFGTHPPAATMVEAGLIDPKYRIEIEVTALMRNHAS